jgi:predicted ATPase
MILQNVMDLSNTCSFWDIELQDFNEEQLNELVASILKMKKEETRSLSSIIHAKSAGNPHFTIQIMSS